MLVDLPYNLEDEDNKYTNMFMNRLDGASAICIVPINDVVITG